MKILSWNVHGLGRIEKRVVVEDVIRRNKVHLAMIQESKISCISDGIAKELWGSRSVKWLAVDSVGSAGGIILLWDARFTL